MIKNILVPLTGFANDASALNAAYLVGAQHAANIVSLHVQPDPMQIAVQAALGQFGTTMGGVELLHALEAGGEKRTAKAKAVFDAFMKRISSPGDGLEGRPVTASWHVIEGDPIADTLEAARYSDLVVLGRASDKGAFTASGVSTILVGCGRPVLLVPQRALNTIGAHIAVAWKETAESARAVSAAMPLLGLAKRITVISVNEAAASPHDLEPAAQLADQLARHGLSPEAIDVPANGRSASQALLQTIHDCGADLLVMGAYSHSRFRELVFGGFTRQILGACDIPVLLLH